MRGALVGAAAVAAALGLAAGTAAVQPADAGAVSRELAATLGAPDLVCPGPETLQVPEGGNATSPGGAVVVSALLAGRAGATGTVQAGGDPSSVAAAAAKLLPAGSPRPVAGTTLPLTVGDSGAGVAALAVAGLGPVRVSSEDDSAVLGATQSTTARAGDLRALTTTGCGPAVTDSWLVGGATRAGERLRLLLSNPAATAGLVDVQVFGPKGRVAAPAGDGVAVPAGGQVPLYIDALAPGLDRVVVHVRARTGQVRAVLHDSLLRGLTAGGADDVAAGAAPARRQLVPGISLVNGYGKGAENPALAGSTSVRVAVPGAEEAVVRVTLMDSSGQVQLPADAVRNVGPGEVVDVPVSGVPSGNYTALVESDVPVVAGAQIGRKATLARRPGGEFGWARAAEPLSGDGYVVLPPGARAALSLASADETGETGEAGTLLLTTVGADGAAGAPRTVQVGAGDAGTVQLDAGAVAVRLSGFTGGPVVGAVVATVADAGGELISVLPVQVAGAVATTSVAQRDSRLGLR